MMDTTLEDPIALVGLDFGRQLGRAFLAHARRTLVAMAADPRVLVAPPERDAVPGGYRRALLHEDPAGRFGVWQLWWPPGAVTPVHDHHCDCVFTVVSGVLHEARYRIGDDAEDPSLLPRATLRRVPGDVVGSPKEGGMIHRMGNRGTVPAVSLHAYAYPARAFASSVRRCYALQKEIHR